MPRRHATEFIHGSRRQRALERSEPVGLMWIGHDRLLFSDSRARDASGPGRGYLHTAASRPLQLARRGWAASDPSTSRPGYETQFSKWWCSLSFGSDTRRLGSVEGRARRRSPPGGSRCSLHGLLRPLLLFLRLSTAGSTAACASGVSPPMVASLSAAGAQALGGGSFNYTFTPCSALVGGSSRSRCAAAMLCRDAPLGQPSGTSSSAARGLTPWPPSRTRCDSDGDAGGNESLAAAAARRASAGGRASRVLLLAVRAPLRAAIVVTIAYADSGGKSSPAEVHGARQRRSPSSPPATAPSPP